MNDYFSQSYTFYLVNPTDAALESVAVTIGGWLSDDDGVIPTSDIDRSATDLVARSYIEIGTSSDDEFDEFVTTCQLRYRSNGVAHKATFSAGKSLKGAEYSENLPVLNKPGWILER